MTSPTAKELLIRLLTGREYLTGVGDAERLLAEFRAVEVNHEREVAQWRRRALRAEGAVRHAMWIFPSTYPKAETAQELVDRLRGHFEYAYPDLAVRYDHQPIEVYKWTDACDCVDDGSRQFEEDHSQEADDGYVCAKSFLGYVCEYCKDDEGDGPEWAPYSVEWPCPPIAGLNVFDDTGKLVDHIAKDEE